MPFDFWSCFHSILSIPDTTNVYTFGTIISLYTVTDRNEIFPLCTTCCSTYVYSEVLQKSQLFILYSFQRCLKYTG